MKRLQLIAAALCLVMLLTVGAGVVAAQGENLRHAGESSIYFYDVKATETHGTGTLKIDTAKHTFVFNGKDFTPDAMIELKAKATDSTDYVVFATGKATPSGNLHIAGTWEKDAAPAVVGMWRQSIDEFSLWNEGWFAAQLACYYSTDDGITWHESSAEKSIFKGEKVHVELRTLGVPNDALVKIHAIVVGGKDRTGSEVYQYNYVSPNPGQLHTTAQYKIQGVTWNPDLWLVGLYQWQEI